MAGCFCKIREFRKQQRERRRELHFAKFAVMRMLSLEENPNFHSHVAVTAWKQIVWRSRENVTTKEKDAEPKGGKNQFSQL